ncbi:MAG: YerC/YecD family TrpR-related protein [Pseudomonadota bacterium]
MKRNTTDNDNRKQALYKTLLALKTAEEVDRFLDNLCTPSELEAMADRWLIVEKLVDGLPYRTIAEQTGASVTTVTRVARCLNEENSGYQMVYKRVNENEK